MKLTISLIGFFGLMTILLFAQQGMTEQAPSNTLRGDATSVTTSSSDMQNLNVSAYQPPAKFQRLADQENVPVLVPITAKGTPKQLQAAIANFGADAAKAIQYGRGQSLPHAAIVNDQHPGVLRVLATSGVNLDKQDSDGRTALHHAIDNKNLAAARVLVEQGATLTGPDVENEAGLSPLRFCEAAPTPPPRTRTCRLILDTVRNRN